MDTFSFGNARVVKAVTALGGLNEVDLAEVVESLGDQRELRTRIPSSAAMLKHAP